MSHLPRDHFCVDGQWDREVETGAFTLGDLKKNFNLNKRKKRKLKTKNQRRNRGMSHPHVKTKIIRFREHIHQKCDVILTSYAYLGV